MYKLVMKRQFRKSGRFVKNLAGVLVVFNDGVALVSSDDTADFARRQHFIATVSEVTPVKPQPVKQPEVEEQPEEEEVVEDVEEEEQPQTEEEVTEEEFVEVPDEESDNQPSAEEISSLYEELGTWTAVAEHLGVTTTTLRKYREDAGLT